ncbi:F-box/LRR-repeat protein 15 [Nilaparvata lugens]|uniref:F-box/LRR-repeat protein 15 n=1 Tax=Nilaparvata lugens TaxID=108931 RepID=UPI00193DF8C8|nr:F-box/LRR-repeat protein 15 [Nilaparvata lugens]
MSWRVGVHCNKPPAVTCTHLILSRTCHNLRTLVIHECDSVTQDDLKYLLGKNVKIKHIDLTRCCKLNSLCLHPVVVHFKDLNALILNHCIWFTTGCLEAFTLYHSKLQMLELSHCSSLGNVSAINSFLMKCKDLHTLNLSGMDCICDSTMETLSHCNFKLRNLDVSYCTRITGYGIRMLVEYCKELRNLKLFGCSSAVQKLAYERVGFPSNVLTLKISIDYDVIPFMSRIPRIMAQV